MYSRNIANLFLAGRIISASHVAYGSTRVMGTTAHGAQAVAMAAVLCTRRGLRPRDLAEPIPMTALQRELLRLGQYIPGLALDDSDDLARPAVVTASSRLRLAELPPDGPPLRLAQSWAMILPLPAGRVPRFRFHVNADRPAGLRMQLRTSSRRGNFTPDMTLAERTFDVIPGDWHEVAVDFDAVLDQPAYVFICLMADDSISVKCTQCRLSGVLSVTNRFNSAVAKSNVQSPPSDIGVDTFEFWVPQRRPGGHNLAMSIEPPLDAFSPALLTNGVARPTTIPNAWVSISYTLVERAAANRSY
jgi:hypothetical protein